MNDENSREIYKTLQNGQDKYIYFLLATTITAIGFVITRTQNLKLNITQIPLGISVLSLAISFLYGCKNREYANSTLYANYDLLRVQRGQDQEVGTNPQLVQAKSEIITSAMETNSNKANKCGRKQMLFFEVGVFFYIVWHILEMFLKV